MKTKRNIFGWSSREKAERRPPLRSSLTIGQAARQAVAAGRRLGNDAYFEGWLKSRRLDDRSPMQIGRLRERFEQGVESRKSVLPGKKRAAVHRPASRPESSGVREQNKEQKAAVRQAEKNLEDALKQLGAAARSGNSQARAIIDQYRSELKQVKANPRKRKDMSRREKEALAAELANVYANPKRKAKPMFSVREKKKLRPELKAAALYAAAGPAGPLADTLFHNPRKRKAGNPAKALHQQIADSEFAKVKQRYGDKIRLHTCRQICSAIEQRDGTLDLTVPRTVAGVRNLRNFVHECEHAIQGHSVHSLDDSYPLSRAEYEAERTTFDILRSNGIRISDQMQNQSRFYVGAAVGYDVAHHVEPDRRAVEYAGKYARDKRLAAAMEALQRKEARKARNPHCGWSMVRMKRSNPIPTHKRKRAASVRRKYGKAELQRMALAGKKRTARKRTNPAKRRKRNSVAFVPSRRLRKAAKNRRPNPRVKIGKRTVKVSRKGAKVIRRLVAMDRLKGGKRNPESEALDMYRMFHGKDPDATVEYITEEHEHFNLWGLGDLVQLTVRTVGKPNLEQDIRVAEVPRGEKFPDPSRLPVIDRVVLAADEKGKQLFLVSGDQSLDTKALGIPDAELKDNTVVGIISSLVYQTEKEFHKFELTNYTHRLGEDSGVQPVLVYHPRTPSLEIAGGRYRIEKPGIID